MRLFSRLAFLSAAFALGCGNGESDGSIVARAADQSLSVQQVVALVANRPDFPADREVVRTLANLWVDYTLLASAAAHDSTMSQVDVSALVSDLEQDRLIRALRDSVDRVVQAVEPALSEAMT